LVNVFIEHVTLGDPSRWMLMMVQEYMGTWYVPFVGGQCLLGILRTGSWKV
jgi:hypothetical protein